MKGNLREHDEAIPELVEFELRIMRLIRQSSHFPALSILVIDGFVERLQQNSVMILYGKKDIKATIFYRRHCERKRGTSKGVKQSRL